MKRQIGILAVLLLAGLDGVSAQRPGRRLPPGARDQRGRMEQRIQARFDGLVRDQLELSDQQGRQLGDLVEGFRQRREELALKEGQSRRRLTRRGEAIREGREFSDEEASVTLEAIIALREEETRLFREEQEALAGVLTPQQLIRFIVMREELAERIQRIRSGGGSSGGPGRRPPGGILPGR